MLEFDFILSSEDFNYIPLSSSFKLLSFLIIEERELPVCLIMIIKTCLYNFMNLFNRVSFKDISFLNEFLPFISKTCEVFESLNLAIMSLGNVGLNVFGPRSQRCRINILFFSFVKSYVVDLGVCSLLSDC